MDKIIGYKEKDIKEQFNWIMSNIRNVSERLVVISQQLDGKRSNINSDYAKEAYNKLENVVKSLNDFYETDRIPSFGEAESDLEKDMKKEYY